MRRQRQLPWVGLPNILCAPAQWLRRPPGVAARAHADAADAPFIVPELIQHAATPQALAAATLAWLGADVGNIQRFRQHYHQPKIIVLTDNYRSAADILTAARGVITQGTDRLENTIDGLSKQLTAHASGSGARVEVQEFTSVSEERAGVAQQIAEMIKRGE